MSDGRWVTAMSVWRRVMTTDVTVATPDDGLDAMADPGIFLLQRNEGQTRSHVVTRSIIRFGLIESSVAYS